MKAPEASVRVIVPRRAVSDYRRCAITLATHFFIKLYAQLGSRKEKSKKRGVTGNTDFVSFITVYCTFSLQRFHFPIIVTSQLFFSFFSLYCLILRLKTRDSLHKTENDPFYDRCPPSMSYEDS